MAKPRAKTLQERMGFMEDDLTTPGHDAIMLWLDANMDTCIQDWLGIDAWTPTERHLIDELTTHWHSYIRWTRTLIDRARETLLEPDADQEPEDRVQAAIRYMNSRSIQSEIEEIRARARVAEKAEAEVLISRTAQVLVKDELPLSLAPFPGIKVTKKVWEQPLTTQREYTIGFIDLVVSWKRPMLSYIRPEGLIQTHRSEAGHRWEWNQYAAWEEWQPTWDISFVKQEVAFEVKTTIPSLGELLRQLKLYEQHFTGRIFVVAPDARFAEKIREQGFGFIQSPNNL